MKFLRDFFLVLSFAYVVCLVVFSFIFKMKISTLWFTGCSISILVVSFFDFFIEKKKHRKRYSYSYNKEEFFGEFKSVKGALSDAKNIKNKDCVDCSSIYVGEIMYPDIGSYFDVDQLVDYLETAVADDIYRDISFPAVNISDLNKFKLSIIKIISKYCKCEYFNVINIREFKN